MCLKPIFKGKSYNNYEPWTLALDGRVLVYCCIYFFFILNDEITCIHLILFYVLFSFFLFFFHQIGLCKLYFNDPATMHYKFRLHLRASKNMVALPFQDHLGSLVF